MDMIYVTQLVQQVGFIPFSSAPFRKQGHYDEIERGNVPMRPNLWYHVLVDQDPGIARQCGRQAVAGF
ncbi:hypothetical protein HO173_004878 [Letharia columbiana]|uniref:Uncharacterized protein n=1 Tax=Letharia columbiana TaxID=112416 RepID=A0A8H6FYE0_9LECA|nr:uncharacterized protein HO173_004878 [Letharia columbiana]KAF6236999.1 hypothetical protein HO173_004878 [Letharia columbiana]